MNQNGILLLRSDFEGLPPAIYGVQPIAHDEENRSISYSGMSENGKPLHITQWKISLNKLRSELFPYKIPNADRFNIAYCIKKHVHNLINLPPCENVVGYYSVICEQDETNLTVSLARNVVNGFPMNAYSNITNWTVSRVRQIANALLETLAYMQKYKLSHGNLNNSTVFIDDLGKWKVIDYSITTYLNYLASDDKYFLSPTVKRDILDLAELIESIDVSSCQVSAFVAMCNSASSVSELTEHPFLRTINRSFDDFIVEKVLGKGGFGEVLEVKDARIEKKYAIKRITDTKKSTLNKAMMEVKALAGLSHKNIVRYYRSWTETMNFSEYKRYKEPSSDEEIAEINENTRQKKRKREKQMYVMYIQMELCKQDLRKVIKLNELEGDISRIRKFFFGIAEGLKFIHSKNRIHRDLKPDNIFLTLNDTIKIGDFGLSTTRKSLSKAHCGTKQYMAPEIGKRGVKARADMYSLGIILFEMCVPMKSHHHRDDALYVIREKDSPIQRFMEESHPFFRIIKNLLNHEVEMRYTAIKLLAVFPNYKRELQSTSCAQTLTLK